MDDETWTLEDRTREGTVWRKPKWAGLWSVPQSGVHAEKKKKRSACRMEHRSATGLPFSTLKSWGVCLPLEIVSMLRQGVAPAEVGFESTHVLEARLTS